MALPADADEALPFDSHCHLATPLEQPADAVLVRFPRPGACVCGTAPGRDWDAIAALARAASDAAVGAGGGGGGAAPPAIVAGFGVHPWWAGDALPDDWPDRLCALLAAFPAAIVGEIGLDKARTGDGATMEKQMAVFEAQLDIAARFARPVSVHCVRAFGPMLDVMRRRKPDALPPRVVFHGYTGSIDFATSLLKLPKKVGARFYFGVGARTTLTLAGAGELLAALPAARVLVESDADGGPADVAARLRAALPALARHPALSVAALNANFLAAMAVSSPPRA